MTKKFHIGDVLSITTGRLVSRDGMGGVYKILEYMSGEKLMTHQLPRISRECRPVLLRQYPQLIDVKFSGVKKDNLDWWLTEQIKSYGEMLNVNPLSDNQHEHIHPFDEENLKEKNIIVCEESSIEGKEENE